jgi:hypothetical protein
MGGRADPEFLGQIKRGGSLIKKINFRGIKTTHFHIKDLDFVVGPPALMKLEIWLL